ncbi:actin-like ATPase domain-containing protein [Leucogyrophana mollusca]|uniref:Actin-like ATPase domain-containing protein n=1 Tax=Leucogyrophana mollusca TaxID=85980 RepID=A0ACB8BPE3_9AGAM|nr:actin-like ATPase domain-containing protein [Leucogyrophana mollusca]
MVGFRDSSIIVIETGRTLIRAGAGLHELIRPPALTFSARVGLRRGTGETSNGTNTNGRPSLRPGDSSENIRPSASTSRASSLPHQPSSTAKVNDYLVGTQLDEALEAGQDILVSWPFADGDVRDWTQAEAIWKYVLFNQLNLRRAQNESPVMLSIAPGLSRDASERICQIFFERFNVAGFAIVERPMAQLYAAGVLSGVVVDIGYEKTDITPIYDGFAVHTARTTTSLGIRDCQSYLAHLFRSNTSVMAIASPSDAPTDTETTQKFLLDLVKHIWEEGLVRVPSDGQTVEAPEDEGVTDIAAVLVAGKEKAVIESGLKKKATAKASAAEQARAKEIEAMDLVTVQFREHSLTIGKERHRFCEPLFDPTLLKAFSRPESEVSSEDAMPLQDAVGTSVSQTEVDQRQYIWQGLFVTGDLTNHVKGIGAALQSRLSPYILSNPEQQNEVQPRSIRVLSVPEYFAEYREKGDGLAAFLGTSIVAKVAFNDSQGKNFVSKTDYNEKGPRAIIEMSPALL